MRVDVSFKAFQSGATSHQAIDLVRTYVNDCIGDRYYGPGMTWIDISICSRAKPDKKLKRTRRYPKSFAEHVLYEVRAEFGPDDELSLQDFQTALKLVGKCIADSHDCWNGEFRLNEFQHDYVELTRAAPANIEDLKLFANQAASLSRRIELKWLRAKELRRFHDPQPLGKTLSGIRCYPSGRLERALEPYAGSYCRLFEGLLRYAKWKTPGYQEIYINLDETDELVRLSRSAIEEWHENAYAVIPLEEFEAGNRAQKCTLVFEACCQALRELAAIDHLAPGPLEAAIQTIQDSGFETDLVYLEKLNSDYQARVLYRVLPGEPSAVYRLQVVQVATGRIAERPLDVQPNEELYLAYRFSKLELTKKEVRIRARSGERAKTSLKRYQRPDKIVFSLAELFRE